MSLCFALSHSDSHFAHSSCTSVSMSPLGVSWQTKTQTQAALAAKKRRARAKPVDLGPLMQGAVPQATSTPRKEVSLEPLPPHLPPPPPPPESPPPSPASPPARSPADSCDIFKEDIELVLEEIKSSSMREDEDDSGSESPSRPADLSKSQDESVSATDEDTLRVVSDKGTISVTMSAERPDVYDYNQRALVMIENDITHLEQELDQSLRGMGERPKMEEKVIKAEGEVSQLSQASSSADRSAMLEFDQSLLGVDEGPEMEEKAIKAGGEGTEVSQSSQASSTVDRSAVLAQLERITEGRAVPGIEVDDELALKWSNMVSRSLDLTLQALSRLISEKYECPAEEIPEEPSPEKTSSLRSRRSIIVFEPSESSEVRTESRSSRETTDDQLVASGLTLPGYRRSIEIYEPVNSVDIRKSMEGEDVPSPVFTEKVTVVKKKRIAIPDDSFETTTGPQEVSEVAGPSQGETSARSEGFEAIRVETKESEVVRSLTADEPHGLTEAQAASREDPDLVISELEVPEQEPPLKVEESFGEGNLQMQETVVEDSQQIISTPAGSVKASKIVRRIIVDGSPSAYEDEVDIALELGKGDALQTLKVSDATQRESLLVFEAREGKERPTSTEILDIDENNNHLIVWDVEYPEKLETITTETRYLPNQPSKDHPQPFSIASTSISPTLNQSAEVEVMADVHVEDSPQHESRESCSSSEEVVEPTLQEDIREDNVFVETSPLVVHTSVESTQDSTAVYELVDLLDSTDVVPYDSAAEHSEKEGSLGEDGSSGEDASSEVVGVVDSSLEDLANIERRRLYKVRKQTTYSLREKPASGEGALGMLAYLSLFLSSFSLLDLHLDFTSSSQCSPINSQSSLCLSL